MAIILPHNKASSNKITFSRKNSKLRIQCSKFGSITVTEQLTNFQELEHVTHLKRSKFTHCVATSTTSLVSQYHPIPFSSAPLPQLSEYKRVIHTRNLGFSPSENCRTHHFKSINDANMFQNLFFLLYESEFVEDEPQQAGKAVAIVSICVCTLHRQKAVSKKTRTCRHARWSSIAHNTRFRNSMFHQETAISQQQKCENGNNIQISFKVQ